MTEKPVPETEGNKSGAETAGEENASGRDFNWADEEVPQRGPRANGEGRYDLSWDGVSGGCGTDEG